MKLRAVAILTLALLPACRIPGPKPPEPPPTPLPEPQCQPGQTHSCWHQPPDSAVPLYACPAYDTSGAIVGIINVVEGPAKCPAKPAPPAQDACSPALDPSKSPPVAADSAWPYAANQVSDSAWKQTVWAAVRSAQQACPAAWSGDCMVGGPGSIDKGYLLISKELQVAGVSAAQGMTPSGERKDHLWVQREPGSRDWNATKLFYYGNGCLITGDGAFSVHGWYTYSGDAAPPVPPPPPPPLPPPASGCSTPLPPKVWTAATLPPGWGSDRIGTPRWEIGCGVHPNGRVIDCTAKVAPQACEYCDSIGMGEIGGQIRCGCPVRNECKPVEQTPPQNFKCEERVACEKYLTGGTKLESRNGATCEFVGDNPFQFWPSGGNCRVCSVEDPRVCGGWF